MPSFDAIAESTGVPNFDMIIVGSGINSLVCAALLTQRGRSVCVLERNEVLGGCLRTEELTRSGFKHDTLATLFPLFTSAPHYAALEQPLREAGVEFLNSDTPTGVLLPDGRAAVLTRDRQRNAEEFARLAADDGKAYRRAMEDIEKHAALTFTLLGEELWTLGALRKVLRHAWRTGVGEVGAYGAAGLASCRSWLSGAFVSDVARTLIAPWVLHVGLGPESAGSALMAKLILFTLEGAGSPVVRGGSAGIVTAFAQLIAAGGGECHTHADVERILTVKGVARGVRLKDGREFHARQAVVCNVTPEQLYERLLRDEPLAQHTRDRASRYRYGRAEMQIHLALGEPPEWPDARLASVAMLHVSAGMDAVSRAVNEAERGVLPAEATIVVAQPVALDPSRAPPGQSILWIQLQELPSRIRGDALGEILVPADGRWTAAVREQYADRIVARLAQLIPNLNRSVLARHVISPADLELLNINLVGGDPYSGDCSLDQFLLWRPSFAHKNHRTSIKRLFHIGASSHPGPGLGGMSGYLLARQLS